MKPTLLCIILTILSLTSHAQISDFTTDSCYFSESLDIINRVITNQECIDEFDYAPGDNELIVFGLRTINMGQHDADFLLALDTTGLFFDTCHYHSHIRDWNYVYLLNECRDTVAKGAKVGYNLLDGGNVITAINVGYMACFGEWIVQYGAIDYALGVHPPNDNFNGDTHMGTSAGYFDTYPPGTWGNSIKIDGVPNGTYSLACAGNFSRYFNQGLNIFPDGFEVIVTIDGIAPNRTISAIGTLPVCVPKCDASNPDPLSISVSGNVVSWDSTGACDFDDLEILIWNIKRNGQAEYRIVQKVEITTQTSHIHNGLSDRELQRYARQLSWSFNGGKFSYGYKIGNTIYKP